MQLHKSGLQTSQRCSQEDPARRHHLNKEALERFYQQISTSLARESKLQKLHDTQFINWSRKQTYWDVVKFSSDLDNVLNEEVTKIQISNAGFHEMTTDRKEIQFDLKSASAVVIQTRQEFDDIKGTLEVEGEIQQELKQENNQVYRGELQTIKNRYSKLFGVFTEWHYPKAVFRIILLVSQQIDKDKMLLIYNNESQNFRPLVRGSQMDYTSFKESDFQKANFMKELIKCHVAKQTNGVQLRRLRDQMLHSAKDSVLDKITTFLENKKKSQNRLTKNLGLGESFKFYDQLQSEGFLNRWRNKSVGNAKQKQLMVEITQIYVRGQKPREVSLVLQTKKNQSTEQYRKKYDFRQTQGEYSIYQISPLEERKCSPFSLTKGTMFKEVNIKVEVSDSNNSKGQFQNQYIYFKLEGEESFPHQLMLKDLGGCENVQGVFVVLKTLQSKSGDLTSVEDYHHRLYFDQVGSIPTKYKSMLRVDYNPNTFDVVRRLLASQLPAKITKHAYQQCYFALVSFLQGQQNKSQMSVAHLSLSKVTHKCPMRQRLGFYQRQLLKDVGDSHIDNKGLSLFVNEKTSITDDENRLLGFLNFLDDKMLGQLSGRQFMVDQHQYKNMQSDLAIYKPLNAVLIEQLLIKYLHFVNRLPRIKLFSFPLRYSPHLIPILQKYVLIFFNSKTSTENDNFIDRTKQVVHFFSFMLFVARLYPYSQPTTFKFDLMTIRWLAQQKLGHYNDYLNRNHIGLENLIAPHLLNMFSNLSEELTLRIWDYLVSCDNPNKGRIIVAFTLLTYFQSTRNLPIIPINQFMADVAKNFSSFASITPPAWMGNSAQNYLAGQTNKSKRLQKLVQSSEKTIVDDKQLQKLILGDKLVSGEKQRRVQAKYKANKMVQPIKEISYPLPKPGYFGHQLQELILFVHNLNILQNINLMAQKYVLRFEVPQSKDQKYLEVPIISKNHFYNQSFKVPLLALDQKIDERQQKRSVIITVVRRGHDRKQNVELLGEFNYSHYHKDRAYKIVVPMQSNNKHNKGQTVLSLTFCLKSQQHNQKLEERDFTALQKLSEEYLDYDMGGDHQILNNLRQLHDSFEHIKTPLDEFSAQQNKRLQNSAINYHDSPWLYHSKTTVQQLKTIFYHLFPQEKEQDLKLMFSKIYEIFSEEHQMQYIQLVEVLTRIILSVNVTRKKKLTYLYCLGVHYQNSYSKKLTSETLNSMIRMVLKQQGFINSCPYDTETCGKIQQAYFFSSSFKSAEEKTSFTQILQDWAYICNYKHQFNAVLLGTANNLSLLRSLFDGATLRKIEGQPECRFEIVYQLQGKKYLWSAVVDSKTFEVLKRGTKFLNAFDGYNQLKYLDSTQEYLYNCENIIPLQVHKSYSYADFIEVMNRNTLVRYALDMPSMFAREEPKYEIVRTRDIDQRSSKDAYYFSGANAKKESDRRVIDHEEEQIYDSWALHRSQNCLESWRKCCIVNPGSVLTQVKFQNSPDIYTITTLDLISMDEIDLDLEIKRQLVKIITG